MLAEEFIVVDPASSMWNAVRPLLEAALRLEQQAGEDAAWHGWRKQDIDVFLHRLPDPCTLLVGVWDEGTAEGEQGREMLVVGCICEVRAGEICTLRTLEALKGDLPPLQELEPGYQHAAALLRAAKMQIAPVAWALFTDWTTWNEWVYAEDEQKDVTDKGALLAELARQGRCVLLGSQAAHHHHP